MDEMPDRDDRASLVTMFPYELRALRQRQFASLAAEAARPTTVRAGIRHIASGRMTLTHTRLKTAMAILRQRTASRRGLLEDQRLEAILVDGDRRVFAGFWA
jgi:hypothetical protein